MQIELLLLIVLDMPSVARSLPGIDKGAGMNLTGNRA